MKKATEKNYDAPIAVTLEYPINIGSQEVSEVTINKPNVAALRGISLRALVDLDADTILKVIPRVSEPFISQEHAVQLQMQDMLNIGMAITSFLLPKSARADMEKLFSSPSA